MNTPISRRRLLQILATAAGGMGLLGLQRLFSSAIAQTPADTVTPQAYVPLVAKAQPTATPTRTPTPTPTATVPPGSGPKVIHVHSTSATSWNFSSGWYGNYVNQTKINDMVNEGLKRLTSKSSVAAAWQALLSGYAAGKAIAIKVNFNNASCSDTENHIDALIEPVNALITGMKTAGVREQDIWIFDATRPLPTRFRSRCLYSGIRFFDVACAETASFNSNDPNAQVVFANSHLKPRRIPDVLINATYLINMPIMKDHAITGVTLGFKNHLGTIDVVERASPDSLHDHIGPGNTYYSASYNPMVEIFNNPHIRNKTILTVGDGLFGGLETNTLPPERWQTFGNAAPNSLFFAVDPVAIDCVMTDVLHAESAYHPHQDSGCDDYLKLAAAAGLGVYERGNPWGTGYQKISYVKVEM